MRLTIVLALLFAIPASAQRLTGGVVQPDGDLAAGTGGHMLDINPAGLGFGSSADLAYTFAESEHDAWGNGHAIHLSLGFGALHGGLGIQVLNPPGRQSDLPVKVSLGSALKLSSRLSIGFGWHTFVADRDPLLDGLSTWDIGLQFRPWRWIATGLTVTDLTSPLLGGLPIPRGYEAGLSVRPGTERLALTMTARLPESDLESSALGGFLQWRAFGSFALQARYDTTHIDAERSHRLIVGIADIGRAGLGLFGYMPDLAGKSNTGLVVTTRFQADTPDYPALFPRPIVAEVVVNSADEFSVSGLFSPQVHTPFLDTLLALRELSERDDVAGILLSLGNAGLGFAQATELREAIKAVRAKGKTVLAYLPVGNMTTYSVAAAADRVYTVPAGGIAQMGMHGERSYFADGLERLGVKAQFVAIGKYKSAPEAYTQTGPSEASQQVADSIYDDVYQRLIGYIAAGRKVERAQVEAWIDRGTYTAEAAKTAGLIDGVLHYDEFEGLVREMFGARVHFAPAEALLSHQDERWGRQPAIGLLYATGPITDGKSVANPFLGTMNTGADTFIVAARQMREDPNVRAVVLRIDSPGGSVTAADAMWRELHRLAEAKPLIVSMGNIAASGGYYIAAPGHEILATADTLTGSIGIFTGKFDISGLLHALGISRHHITRGRHAALFSASVPWNDEDMATIRREMKTLYDLFLSRVADGRDNLDVNQVDVLAQGRVWTGAQARQCGLVDRPAGFLTAIDLAVREAGLGIGDYRLFVPPVASGLPSSPLPFSQALLGYLGLAGIQNQVAAVLPGVLQSLGGLPILAYPPGTTLALLPFDFGPAHR